MPAETVDLFAAIDAGQIKVLFVPHDSQSARISITNNSDQRLAVRMPDTFAALPTSVRLPADASPLLAQMGNPGFGNGASSGANAGNRPQALGVLPGGNNGPANQQQPMPGMPNFWNVAAGNTIRRNVACVCLEHGQIDPRAGMKYTLAPSNSSRPTRRCMPCSPSLIVVAQVSAFMQAAAWSQSSKMSWDELARSGSMPSTDRANPTLQRAKSTRLDNLSSGHGRRLAAWPRIDATKSAGRNCSA